MSKGLLCRVGHQAPGSVLSILPASSFKPHEVSGPGLCLPQIRKLRLSEFHVLTSAAHTHQNWVLDGGHTGADDRQAVMRRRQGPFTSFGSHFHIVFGL